MYSNGEQKARDIFAAHLSASARKTQRVHLVCLVGLVGSGKTTLATALAKKLGAVIVRTDAIRVELHKQGEGYAATRRIAEDVTWEFLEQETNVVLDADVILAEHRIHLQKEIRKINAQLHFVRVVCDPGVMMERIIAAAQAGSGPALFKKARSIGGKKGPTQEAAARLRDLWRRTPHHYRWTSTDGGSWVLRKLNFPICATVDTTKGGAYKKAAGEIVRNLL